MCQTKFKTIRETHDGKLRGHYGIAKTAKKLKEFYWEKRRSVEEYVGKCKDCALFNQKMAPNLEPIETLEPLEIVRLDLLEIGTAESGNRYLLTVVDSFSQYGATIPLQDKSARSVAIAFVSK